jgi:hypothetical protein
MKKILALSILLTVLSSCMHMGSGHGGGHGGMKCGCDKGKPCAMDSKESKDGKPAECDDCKKAK